MKENEIFDIVAIEFDLPRDLIENTYKAYWKFIRDTIEKLPLKDDLSAEEYENLRTSINLPSLGKLNCTYKRYLGLKNRFKLVNKLRNNNEY